MSSSSWLHGLQHARLPCHSLSPRVCSNSCPLSRWCHPTISSSVTPLSPCPQSFPVPGSFLMSQFFPSGGQNIGASASALEETQMHITKWKKPNWKGYLLYDILEKANKRIKEQWSRELLRIGAGFTPNLALNHCSHRQPCTLRRLTISSTGSLPQMAEERIKEDILISPDFAFSHTWKNAKFLNLRYLIFFN